MKRNKRTHEEWLNELSHSHDGNYDSCDKYGIKLLRIPYWEFDRVEEILIEEVKVYGI